MGGATGEPKGKLTFDDAGMRDHLPTLDGLRAVAVLLVLWAHLPIDSWHWLIAAAERATQPGRTGVDIFFVLSGFLITRILLHDKKKGKSLGRFMMRRFLRIFPIYYLLILVLLVIHPGMYLAWAATYLSNFAFAVDGTSNPLRHTWSLAVEEHYYMFWPFIVYLLAPVRAARVAMIAVPVMVALTTYFTYQWLPGDADDLIYRGSQYRAFSLSLGASVAFLEPWLRRSKVLMPSWGVVFGSLGTGWMLLGAMYPGIVRDLALSYGIALVSLGVLLVTIYSNESRLLSPYAFVLKSSPMQYIGRVSYGLYLYHYPVFWFMGVLGHEEAGRTSPSWTALALLVSFALTALSYHLIETPILKLKDRFK